MVALVVPLAALSKWPFTQGHLAQANPMYYRHVLPIVMLNPACLPPVSVGEETSALQFIRLGVEGFPCGFGMRRFIRRLRGCYRPLNSAPTG